MIVSRLLNYNFTSILFILLITLQMTACSSEQLNSATGDIGLDTGTGPEPGINPNNVAEVNLSWVAPAEREDNTPLSLSEIAGYKIYYGTIQGQYPNSIDIKDGIAEGYTFTDLPVGTYYIVVTTRDTEGRESQFSPEIKKVI